ncbi:MAG TPA: protein kinase [Pyrinomonadaceae bacterium]|nr:protein kinase [Pyrinomonadaceae bacterium]
MSPDRWKQIEEIFQAALDLAPGERAAFLERACAGDGGLRAQVEALVGQFDRADSFGESRAVSADESQLFAAPPVDETDPMEGRRVGAYRLVREIGRGGMGAVYLAERADSAFQRRVAVKLVKRGMDTDFILRRFRNERQILASLNHPNIGRLLDGGSTEDGLPYFVMEYIQGQPVYHYCDERRLTVRARLQLFSQVAAAVAYAHQNLIIHRDIKPSNILVTAAGVPKLLDFGIAKLLNPELAADTSPMTATAMRLMTPEYASPEQVQGLAVTPASDVYSMGVMLYELLSGHRPYRLRHRSPHEVSRVICEDEPERPSVTASSAEDILPVGDGGPATPEALAGARGATLEELRRELAGGVDQIVMKALRKEPQRRYRTAEELREDIARHLEGRPVSAPAYFPAPRPAKAAAAESPATEKTLAVLPLKLLSHPSGRGGDESFLGVGLADALITRLSNVRRLAVRPTSAVLRYAAADGDPLGAGRELGVQFVLDGRIRRAGERIRVTVQLLDVREGASVWAGQFDETFTDVLSLEDDMSERVAEALIPHLSGDERQQLAKRGTDNPEAFEAYLRGRYHWNTFTVEGFAEALVCYQRAVALAPDYALAYAGIADYYNWLGIYAVLPFAETSAAAKEAALKAVALDDTLAEAYAALGFATMMHDFDWEACGRYLRRAVELNPNYVTGRLWYSYFLGMSGRFDEAMVQVRRALELDPLTPIVPQTQCWMFYYSRRYEEALACTRQLAAREPRYGLTHVFLSMVLSRTGRHEEAVGTAQKAMTLLGRSPYTMAYLAAANAAAGRLEETRALLEEIARAQPARYVSPYLLAMVHGHLREREQTLAHLERAVEIRDGRLVWLGVDPHFDWLRDEPRFQELVRRTRNPLAGRAPSGPAAPRPRAPRMTGERSAATTAPVTHDRGEAQQLYAAGRYFAAKRTADGIRQAIERFERAVEIDPEFAPAWAELADGYALLNWYVEPPPSDAFAKALAAARRAVAADDRLAEAHASLAFIKTHYERDWAGADAEFRRAIELNPDSAISRRWYAFSLSAMGRHEEALAQAMRAQELSPRSAVMAMAVANVLFHARRYDEAVAQCHRALELDPGSVAAHVVMRWSYGMMGRVSEALAVYEKERAFAGDTPTTRAKYAHVLAAAGRAAEARAILSELTASRDEQLVTPYELGLIYALLGDADAAFAWLERAREERAVGLTFIGVDPHVDSLRQDPRFDRLLREIGIR